MRYRKIFSSIYFKILMIIVIFGAGLLIGLNIRRHGSTMGPTEVRLNSSQFHFINPLLYVDQRIDDQPEYKKLESDINSYISTAKDDGKVDTVSVYFRDLNSGQWTGINEDETYAPASMLKVILMIAYLKEAETDPTVLDKKLVYTGHTDHNEYFQPSVNLNQGETYSVRDLILDMITQSDNDANDILLKNIDSNFLYSVYNDLGISLPTDQNPDFMSAKKWSTIFRVLYNGTYLYHPLSEEALEALSETSFNQGLNAGLSTSTIVAHKFGERAENINSSSTQDELHDCGIIYYPTSPYFLCVMTKGNNYDNLKNVIGDISKIVYQREVQGL